MNITDCWRCNRPYEMTRESCPHCGATNANHDLQRVEEEKLTGGAAFPYVGQSYKLHGDGTSLRDYFAAKAISPVMHICLRDTPIEEETSVEMFARKAYEMADAMLKERAK